MGIILAVLLIAILLGGLGFAVHILWVIALIIFLAWLIGFGFGSGVNGGGRWYRRW